MSAIKPPRPLVYKSQRLDDRETWDCYVVHKGKKTYVTRTDTKDQAIAAAMQYIQDGTRPPKRERVQVKTGKRKATLKTERRLKDGTRVYDIIGRIGIGYGVRHIATTKSHAEALRIIEEFNAQPEGSKPNNYRQREKCDQLTRRCRGLNRDRIKSARMPKPKPTPPPRNERPVNRWAALYSPYKELYQP